MRRLSRPVQRNPLGTVRSDRYLFEFHGSRSSTFVIL